MKIGFLYAGQGSQHVGMGKDLYENYDTFRKVLDHVSLDFDIRELCFSDADGRLNQTRYTQPAMVAFAIGVTKLLREKGIVPDMVAGLSLGEYSALYSSGVLSEKDAIETVAYRGRVMEEAGKSVDGAMTAIIGLDRDKLEELILRRKSEKCVVIANYNCPGQMVIGGEREAVDEVAASAKESGARRCMPLSVSGPFHTPLMAKAGEALAARFGSTTFSSPAIPVVFNVLGREKRNDETIESLLVRQVQGSVYMEDTIRYMASKGIDTFIEIGPGKVLSGFVRKTLGPFPCFSVESVEDVESLLEKLGGNGNG